MLMRKIYRIRHIEQMILLTKRLLRQDHLTEDQKIMIKSHLDNYFRVLEITKDSPERPE